LTRPDDTRASALRISIATGFSPWLAGPDDTRASALIIIRLQIDYET
jgi:hypothetical protein